MSKSDDLFWEDRDAAKEAFEEEDNPTGIDWSEYEDNKESDNANDWTNDD